MDLFFIVLKAAMTDLSLRTNKQGKYIKHPRIVASRISLVPVSKRGAFCVGNDCFKIVCLLLCYAEFCFYCVEGCDD
jgi:hypothetical protein